MKLWKGATFVFILCGAALSLLFAHNMATNGQYKPRLKYPHRSPSTSSSKSSSSSSFSSPTTAPPSPASSPSSSSTSSSSFSLSSSRTMGGLRRRVRSADSMNSLLTEFSRLLQSFTEGELTQVVGTLLDRKSRRGRRPGRSQARRTKRAKGHRPCSLREIELTVSELGLGYDSDETLLFRYCSGKCTSHRRNYDITMERMQTVLGSKGRKAKQRAGPCCRPTAYEEDISFLDNRSRYHTIQDVSAQACGCV